MRDCFSNTIAKLGQKNKKIYVVAADISPAGRMEMFQKKYPDRFINVGVAEQTMIGVCAGLAMKKMIPFAYTISTFALYRPFEMIRTDACYQNVPVTIVGMGAGTIYSTLGATHLTQEDVSITRSVPNLQVLAPCDPNELESCIKFCVNKSKKPTYLRIGKTGEKNYTNKKKWKFGKINQIVKGDKVCILSFGPIIKMAFDVVEKIKNHKISIYSCHSLKPFDEIGIKKILMKYKTIITLEDHSIIGGLGNIVQSYAGIYKYKGKIKNFALKDEFIHFYGNQKELLNLHGISVEKMYNFINKDN
ncbi:transketolase [Candidatus Pelagibacter sp.]|nr:transketolase [Candidatus Pelagibacter sp.]|tara:strand:- start:2722 stop:3633 length:912 start_codon:yes stop_codon:yes gene_type:complete